MNSIEFVIDFALTNGCDLAMINNARNEVQKLRQEDTALHQQSSNDNEAIDHLIKLCEIAIKTGKWQLTPLNISEAKNSLSYLRAMKKELAREAYNSNQFATEEMNLYLETAKELGDLQKQLDKPVAWAKTNGIGDLYDLRLQNNPYDDQKKIVPLYRLKK